MTPLQLPFFGFETGLVGLFVVFVYSFLVAFALPFPGEVVLAVPVGMGLPYWAQLSVLVVSSSVGKAVGSLAALKLGHEATRTGPFAAVRNRMPQLVARDGRLVRFVEQYGYVGMALVLAVPLMPDTAVLYAFSVVETDYFQFAMAAFFGTVARLLAVVGLVGGVLSFV